MTPRLVRLTSLLLFAAGLWACWTRIALNWDGAYQFALTLIAQEPYKYLSRFSSWIVWLPTAWASKVTDNMTVLEMLYGAPYCLAPLAGFAISAWVVQKRAPHILPWVAMGICFAPLPGQVFMINDSIFQMHLFWPIFLGALCPVGAGKREFLALFALWQLSHPIGIAMCAMAAAAAALSAWREKEHRASYGWYAVWNALVSVGGIVKLELFPDSYAASEASFSKLYYCFRVGVLGLPLLAILLIWAAVWIVFRFDQFSAIRRGIFARRSLWLMAAGGVTLLVWASFPHIWWKALDYRRWLVPLSLPFFALCWWETWRAPLLSGEAVRLRSLLGWGSAALFAGVLSLQCVEWRGMYQRLEAQVKADPGPVLDAESLKWTDGTVMQHWGTSALIVVMQSPAPHTLLLDKQQLETLAKPEESQLVPLVPAHRFPPEPGKGGWFDFRNVLQRLQTERSEHSS